MQYKSYQKSMLVYRGRKKNNNASSSYESNLDNKTQNLKSIHRNLVEKARNQPQQKTQMQNRQSLKHQITRAQRSSVISQIIQQKQSTNIKRGNYGSMHQLNPYHNKTEPKQQASLHRQSKAQVQQRKLKQQRNSGPRHNLSVQSLIQNQKILRKSEQKRYHNVNDKSINDINKSVNFYINIEKLKNLKITSRDKLVINKNDLVSGKNHLDRNSSYQQEFRQQRDSNSYLTKKTQNNPLSIDKNSIIMKQKNHSLNRSSYQKIQHNPYGGRFITTKKNPQLKSKLRYKTHQNQIDQQQDYSTINNNAPPKSHASQCLIPKKSNFRKHQFKDKSFIQGYLKGKQLGRGGFSKVWQGFHFSTKQFYAVKQIDTTNKYQTHLTQIWFGNYFFQHGRIKPQFQSNSGITKLLKMYQYSIVDPKAFVVYESCDGSLGNLLYDIYQEDVLEEDVEDDDEKMYMIKYKHLYGELRKNCAFMRHFIKSIAEALDLLTQNKIVHSDIKTENILLKKCQSDNKYNFKLIDYGSSFVFQSLKQYKLATPQYMCPQLLNYILFQNKKPCHQYMLQYVKVYQNISAIDVWGLGCIVLELIHGLPLWLNNPTKILVKGKYETKKGLFAVSDRSFSKILERQLSIVGRFDQFLEKQNNSQICINQQIKQVLKAMLNPNPKHRIRPHQIVSRLSQ